jgi:hypothetical protein
MLISLQGASSDTEAHVGATDNDVTMIDLTQDESPIKPKPAHSVAKPASSNDSLILPLDHMSAQKNVSPVLSVQTSVVKDRSSRKGARAPPTGSREPSPTRISDEEKTDALQLKRRIPATARKAQHAFVVQHPHFSSTDRDAAVTSVAEPTLGLLRKTPSIVEIEKPGQRFIVEKIRTSIGSGDSTQQLPKPDLSSVHSNKPSVAWSERDPPRHSVSFAELPSPPNAHRDSHSLRSPPNEGSRKGEFS